MGRPLEAGRRCLQPRKPLQRITWSRRDESYRVLETVSIIVAYCEDGDIPRRRRSFSPMATGTTAYLVVRRDDGFGDVFPLVPGQTYTLGRAATNSIVLKDDLCSRDHAEVSYSGNRWRVRDLGSLNGTRVND